MALDLSALTSEVERNTTVDGSAKALILLFADQIEAAKGDQAKLDALVATMRGSSDDLSAAVSANTPSAPPA